MASSHLSLRHGGYYLIVALRFISSVMIWFDFTSIFSNITFYWHASPFQIGLTSAVYGVPGLILGPIIGRLADTWGPYRILTLSYLARGATSALLYFSPSLEVFILTVACKGISNLGVMPAEQQLIKAMLNQEQIISNAGIMVSVDQCVKIVAPLVISLLNLWLEPNFGFAVSAMVAVLGLLITIIMQSNFEIYPAVVSRVDSQSLLLQIKNLMMSDATFSLSLLSSMFQCFVLGLYDSLLVAVLRDQNLNSGAFGVVVSSTALGALIGAISFKRVFKRYGGIKLVSVSLLGFGLSVLIPGLLGMRSIHIGLEIFSALWILNGFCYAVTAMNFGVIFQTQAPAPQIGLLSSSIRSAQLFLLVIAPILGSSFAVYMSVNGVFAFCGFVTIIFAGGLGLWSSIRNSRPIQ